MIIVEWWKTVVLQRYAKFDGRASRAEFWWFALAEFLVFVAISILAQVSGIFYVLFFVYWAATIVPSIAVAIRRLHDTNKSGWWLLLGLIPFGGLVILVFYIMQGDANSNNFGAPDSGVPATAAA